MKDGIMWALAILKPHFLHFGHNHVRFLEAQVDVFGWEGDMQDVWRVNSMKLG